MAWIQTSVKPCTLLRTMLWAGRLKNRKAAGETLEHLACDGLVREDVKLSARQRSYAR